LFAVISNEKQRFRPVLAWADPDDRRLSFSNVVEAHVLRSLRTKHGISMPDVRKALNFVQKEFGIDRLLIHPDLRATPGKIFLRRYAQLIDLVPSGQYVIERAFAHHLEAVVQDPRGVPMRLYPWIPDPTGGAKTTVVIDPAVAFGRPTTGERGISTAVLADYMDAGASIADLANEFHLSESTVEDALAFERAA
jgi:uncharacterized protein (DUF433 family)